MLDSTDLLRLLAVSRRDLKLLADGCGLPAHGQSRQLEILDCVRLVAAQALRQHGIPLRDAVKLASTVTRAEWQDAIVADGRAWLVVSRDPTRQAKWLTAIATKPAEVDELVKAHPEGATVLHLGPPIRAVLTASLERAEAEQRELA